MIWSGFWSGVLSSGLIRHFFDFGFWEGLVWILVLSGRASCLVCFLGLTSGLVRLLVWLLIWLLVELLVWSYGVLISGWFGFWIGLDHGVV